MCFDVLSPGPVDHPCNRTLGLPLSSSVRPEWTMAYDLEVLNSGTHKTADDLTPEVSAAITANGHWTEFFEVRMAAGPTVKIEGGSDSSEGYRVTVEWGTQQATTQAESLPMSIQVADRMAKVFYDVRNQASHTKG